MGRLLTPENILNLLLIFVPIAIVLEFMHASPTLIFITSCLAIIPLAGVMGKATEHLAEKVGEGIGGLLNATFGNAAELIIAIVALRAGLYDVVKASITGSIIGNILLVFGLSAVLGGAKYSTQKFNSLEIAVILMATYILSLVFTLKTHKHLYAGGHGDDADDAIGTEGWSIQKGATVLLIATAFVAVMSEFLVGAVQATAKTWGMTEVFVGVILVAIIGNAAEHSTEGPC